MDACIHQYNSKNYMEPIGDMIEILFEDAFVICTRRKAHMKNLKAYIISSLFVLWFFVSIVGAMYVSQNGEYWLLLIFVGQYFLVFGLMTSIGTIVSKSFKMEDLFLFIFPLIGIVAIASGFIFQYGSEKLKSSCIKNVPNILLGLFIIAGIYLLMMYANAYLLKKKCTRLVYAKCIEVKEKVLRNKENRRRNNVGYCPVYEFYYNGMTYEVCNNEYLNMIQPEVGKTYEIYVNSNKPKQYYEPKSSKKSSKVYVIIGTAFIVTAVLGIILYN